MAFTFDDVEDEAAIFVDDRYGYKLGSDESLVSFSHIRLCNIDTLEFPVSAW